MVLTPSPEVGQYVEQDEELATIETDKIDVAVNAPDAGVIKELLAAEEDTVTVDQELIRLDVSKAPDGGTSERANENPKSPASSEQATASQPLGDQERVKNDMSQPVSHNDDSSAMKHRQSQTSEYSEKGSRSSSEKQQEMKANSFETPSTPTNGRQERRVS